MTEHKALKKRIRERMSRLGESYTTARRHVLAAAGRTGALPAGASGRSTAELATLAPDNIRFGLLALALYVPVLAALAITRSLSALLYGVTSADALTYGLVALVLAVVCVTVSWLPARRAAHVDPALALRAD